MTGEGKGLQTEEAGGSGSGPSHLNRESGMSTVNTYLNRSHSFLSELFLH